MNSDRSALEKLSIVYSHIGVHLYFCTYIYIYIYIYIYMFVGLIAQRTDDNDYYIGKWMQSGKLIGDK